MNRGLAVMLALAIGLSALATLGIPAVHAATSKPTWTVGDYWVYNVTGLGSAGIPILGSSPATLRYDIKGTTAIPIGNTTVTAYDAKVNLTLQVHLSYPPISLTLTFSGDEWFRTSDLAPAKLALSTTYLGQNASFSLTSDPPPAIPWPLTDGATWAVTSNVTAVEHFPGTSNSTSAIVTASFRVLADQNLTVPAGTFTVTPVRETSVGQNGSVVSYWSSTAGNAASQRYYASNGSEQGAMDLKAYKYQAGSPVPPNLLGVIVLGVPLLVWLVLVAAVVIVILAFARLRRRPPPAEAQGPPLPVQGTLPPSIPPPPPSG